MHRSIRMPGHTLSSSLLFLDVPAQLMRLKVFHPSKKRDLLQGHRFFFINLLSHGRSTLHIFNTKLSSIPLSYLLDYTVATTQHHLPVRVVLERGAVKAEMTLQLSLPNLNTCIRETDLARSTSWADTPRGCARSSHQQHGNGTAVL